MFPDKILIGKRFRPVNTGAPGSISILKVSSLQHEIFNHTMEFRAFVSHGFAEMVFGFAGAEDAEVLCGAGDNVVE